MNKFTRILSITIVLLGVTMLTSCDPDKHRMEVVKDCTGVYLQARDGRDYKVCNDEILDNIAAGTKIKVSFDNLEQCFGLIDPVTCMMEHPYEGVIEITEIY